MLIKMTLREAAMAKGEVLRGGNRGFCPACKRWTRKFNWAENLVNCPACGEDPASGGVLDYWAYESGIDEPDKAKRHKLASRSIQEYYGNTSTNVVRKRKEEAEKEMSKYEQEANIAPISVRHRTYSKLLEYLILSDQHRQDLLNRGLSTEDIIRCGYRSLPNTSRERMCAEMIRDGYTLEGVPGFWKKNGKWVFGYIYLKGIMIPQRDSFGRIHGFQIRTDDQPAVCKNCKNFIKGRCQCEESTCFNKYVTKNDTCKEFKQDLGKYIALSSAKKPSGTSSGSFIHFAIHDYSRKVDYANEQVLLTEGPLKADIANSLSNYDSPILAIPGVSSISYLEIALKELQKRGLNKIWVALDMDYEVNPNVNNSLVKLDELLDKIGLDHEQYRWDLDENKNWRGEFKGLDDWVVHIRKQEGKLR